MTPRQIPDWVFGITWAACVVGLLHVAQQCVAGYVQCEVLGCLPTGGWW